MDLKEIGCRGVVKWIHLTQDRENWQALVKAVMNLQVLEPQSWLVGWYVTWLVGRLVGMLLGWLVG
jgi:hypothetical protein